MKILQINLAIIFCQSALSKDVWFYTSKTELDLWYNKLCIRVADRLKTMILERK